MAEIVFPRPDRPLRNSLRAKEGVWPSSLLRRQTRSRDKANRTLTRPSSRWRTGPRADCSAAVDGRRPEGCESGKERVPRPRSARHPLWRSRAPLDWRRRSCQVHSNRQRWSSTLGASLRAPRHSLSPVAPRPASHPPAAGHGETGNQRLRWMRSLTTATRRRRRGPEIRPGADGASR
jgi:hypothetical protein